MSSQLASARRGIAGIAVSLLAAWAPAQVTSATLQIGGGASLGTNGTSGPGLLSDGTAATASVGITYDASSGVLLLTVENTSPIVPGSNTPVLGDLWMNAPMWLAANTVSFLSQSGGGGASPAYALSIDPNPWDPALVNEAPPFGNFAFRFSPAPGGGIAVPGGIGTPAGATEGPVVFTLQLLGPQVDEVTAEMVKRLFSMSVPVAGNLLSANGLAEFHNAGDGSGEGGVTDARGSCSPIMFWSGTMQIGTVQNCFLQAATDCHGCQLWSPILGSTNLPLSLGFQLAMGGPTNAVNIFFPFTFAWSNFNILPFMIPNDPTIVGATLYWHFVTNPVIGISGSFEVSPLITTTVLP